MAGTVVLNKRTLPSHKDSSCRCVVSTNLLHYYDISGLLSRTVKALYYQQRHTPCTVLAEQCWRPLSQQTHIPAWYGSTCWTTRTKHQLQPCKSLPIMSLEHYKDSMAQGTCRAAGTIGGFTEGCQGALLVMPGRNKEHQLLALYYFDLDVNLWESSQHDKLLNFLISTFLLWQIIEWIKSMIQLISMWSHWKNKFFFKWLLISKEDMIFR